MLPHLPPAHLPIPGAWMGWLTPPRHHLLHLPLHYTHHATAGPCLCTACWISSSKALSSPDFAAGLVVGHAYHTLHVSFSSLPHTHARSQYLSCRSFGSHSCASFAFGPVFIFARTLTTACDDGTRSSTAHTHAAPRCPHARGVFAFSLGLHTFFTHSLWIVLLHARFCPLSFCPSVWVVIVLHARVYHTKFAYLTLRMVV